MFSRIRKRFTYTNIALTLALVFTISGGAYAASKYVITSTKQISPKVLAALKGANGKNGTNGATGPAGPAGPAGSAGAKGEKGETGTDGTNGTNGSNGMNGTTGPKGPTGPAGTTGPSGPSGPTGSPWTDKGTLPKGSTETGAFSITYQATAAGQPGSSAISFPIPLASAPEVHYLGGRGTSSATATGNIQNESTVVEHVKITTPQAVVVVGEEVSGPGIAPETTIVGIEHNEETWQLSEEVNETKSGVTLTVKVPTGCKGEESKPEATEGQLCVYSNGSFNAQQYLYAKAIPFGWAGSLSNVGGWVHVDSITAGEVYVFGTWAVTAG